MREDITVSQRELRQAVHRVNELRLNQAARIRRDGKARYVWRNGLLRFWLPLGALAAVLLTLLVPGHRPPLLGGAPTLVGWLFILLPAGAVAGAAWGTWMWRLYERSWFTRLDARQDPTPPAT